MKTVYQLFVDYFHSIKTNSYDPIPVEQGIAAYLKSIGIDTADTDQHEEIVADRELMRFRLMPETTFVAFFDNYRIRESINSLLAETESLSYTYAINGIKTTQSMYLDKINVFYTMSAEIAGDKRYSEWLDLVRDEITENLKHAAGLSDRIPDKISERILFERQYK